MGTEADRWFTEPISDMGILAFAPFWSICAVADESDIASKGNATAEGVEEAGGAPFGLEVSAERLKGSKSFELGCLDPTGPARIGKSSLAVTTACPSLAKVVKGRPSFLGVAELTLDCIGPEGA